MDVPTNAGTPGLAPANPGVLAAEEELSDPVNPLRDPRDRRIPRVAGPCVVVMFGVTGDLARKKLMPALYDLANRGLLPPGFSLVGFARRDWADEDFAQITYNSVKEHARTPFRETVWEQLQEGVRFVNGEFTDDEAFDQLADTVRQLDVEQPVIDVGRTRPIPIEEKAPLRLFPQDAMLHRKWWEIYNDPELNALEEQVNINSRCPSIHSLSLLSRPKISLQSCHRQHHQRHRITYPLPPLHQRYPKKMTSQNKNGRKV